MHMAFWVTITTYSIHIYKKVLLHPQKFPPGIFHNSTTPVTTIRAKQMITERTLSFEQTRIQPNVW